MRCLLILLPLLACGCPPRKPPTAAIDPPGAACGPHDATKLVACDGRFTQDGVPCFTCPAPAACMDTMYDVYCVDPARGCTECLAAAEVY